MKPDRPPPDPATPPPRKLPRGDRSWFRPFLTFAVFLSFFFLGVALLATTGRSILLPRFVADGIETVLTRQIGQVRLSAAEMTFDRKGRVRLVLRDMSLSDPSGGAVGQVNEFGAAFALTDLLRARIAPSRLDVSGAQITVRRGADGGFRFALAGGGATEARTVADAIAGIETAFGRDPLSRITGISATDLAITLEDARSGRVWRATNARVTLQNTPDRIEVNMFTEVFNGTEDLARLQLSLGTRKGSARAEASASLENAAARDIALQSPALAYLGIVEAPVSGAIRATFDDAAKLESLAATLDLGTGQLVPGGAARPVAFNRGAVYLTYDPARGRIGFSEVSVESDSLRLVAGGQAFLDVEPGGWPEEMVAQIEFTEIEAAPEGVFETPVRLDGARADLRLTFDPFALEIAQAVITDAETRVTVTGRIDAPRDGWRVSVDAGIPTLSPERLLALWPTIAVPGTRSWLARNMIAGELTDVAAALRIRPGRPPDGAVTFAFDDAVVRVLRHMPPVRHGRGHAALIAGGYSMYLTNGTMNPAGGGLIRLDGSVLRIADIEAKPGIADIRLRTEGTLEAALRLMNNAPFSILSKSGLDAEMAQARTRIEAEIAVPLTKKVVMADVAFSATGAVEDLVSDTIVAARDVAAEALDVAITESGLTLTGEVTLDALPVTLSLSQPFAAGPIRPARLNGQVELGPLLLETFGVRLPPGTLTGAARAEIVVELPKGAPPEFRLTSDLVGTALRIPALGVSKPPGTTGTLEIAGRLGIVPEIDTLRIDTPGFSATGRVLFSDTGAASEVAFERVTAGDWFSAPVRLALTGAGPPRITLEGGIVDLRAMPDGTGGQSPGGRVPVTAALDRLIVTDAITLVDMRAEFQAGEGLEGVFQGRVNGASAITGQLMPARGRTALRITGRDLGQTARDAGLFRFASGGAFELILNPRAEGRGYDGMLRASETRLLDQPVVIGLLNAVSVVGLLDQLRGPGVLFDTVNARFRLLPDRVLLDEAAAVGASLGISLDGTYDTGAKQMDLQGVISPIYMLNSVGRFMTRRGEGLFGFTFTVRGPADAPRVSANPLSVLTPGFFREIFRRPPPAPDQ